MRARAGRWSGARVGRALDFHAADRSVLGDREQRVSGSRFTAEIWEEGKENERDVRQSGRDPAAEFRA